MLNDALHFLFAQTWQSSISIFWFFLFIELPRFTLGGIAGIFAALKLMGNLSRRRHADKVFQVSVLLPAHNNGDSVYKTVISLREQINVDLQIIVINDGSNNDTKEICQGLLNKGLIDEFVDIRMRGGKASALNAGLQFVKHPIILATDADTTFDRDAIYQGCLYFNDPTVGAVCGNLRVRNLNASLATCMQGLNYMYGITIARLVKDFLGFYFVISGAFGLFRTHVVKDLYGWNYGPGDDGDMSTQIRISGWRVRFAPLAIAATGVPITFKALGRQRLRWNRSMIRVRYRKYRSTVLNPFRKNFDFMRALSFLESYFFQGLIPFIFLAYVTQLIFQYGYFSIAVLVSVHIVYFVMQIFEFCLALVISRHRREDMSLIKYIPGYPLFHSYFLRLVTLYSTINELITRGSYRDEFYPKKVRKRVKKF